MTYFHIIYIPINYKEKNKTIQTCIKYKRQYTMRNHDTNNL